MKKAVLFLAAIFILHSLTCLTFAFGSISPAFAVNNGTYARCYPPNSYNRFARRQKNYIFSPQQARYYGYRVPQQQAVPNGYYNRRIR